MSCKITSDSSFEEDIKSSNMTILVDFWAEWCGPCKQIGPLLDEISIEMKDKIKILKMNVDENPSTPQKYNVRGIPTLLIFKDGNLLDTKVGSLSKSLLSDWINKHL